MKHTETMNFSCSMLQKRSLDPDASYHRADLLLKIYRKAVWTTEERVDYLHETVYESTSSYTAGLCYLEEFAPDTVKQKLTYEISKIIETRQFIQIIDRALAHLSEYPDMGKAYYDVLYKSYIVKYPYTEIEMLDNLNISRNTLYRRKKDAEYLFAFCLFGCAIPEVKAILQTEQCNKMYA